MNFLTHKTYGAHFCRRFKHAKKNQRSDVNGEEGRGTCGQNHHCSSAEANFCLRDDGTNNRFCSMFLYTLIQLSGTNLTF